MFTIIAGLVPFFFFTLGLYYFYGFLIDIWPIALILLWLPFEACKDIIKWLSKKENETFKQKCERLYSKFL